MESKKQQMSKPIIEVDGLTVRFGNEIALSGVSFSVESGEVVAIVGPNGSGKTTLVRAILNLTPFSGTVLINGKRVSEALERMGYVPQRFNFDLTVPLTVQEFLKLPFPHLSERRFSRALLEVDMKGAEDRTLGTLSGGELQRVLIARSLVSNPTLLFLDEPTSAVDLVGTKGFYEIVSHLRKVHGTTVILISHEIHMVYQFADRIICLNRNLICYGKPEESITKEVLEKLYGKDMRFQPHKH